jgi:hypothetical protein
LLLMLQANELDFWSLANLCSLVPFLQESKSLLE